jgi:hypothetical protein
MAKILACGDGKRPVTSARTCAHRLCIRQFRSTSPSTLARSGYGRRVRRHDRPRTDYGGEAA